MIPIYSDFSEGIIKEVNDLIISHNTLCKIENIFYTNRIANKYFELAKKKLIQCARPLSSSAVFEMAIEYMANDAKDNDDYDTKELLTKIHNLEHDNMILKSKLESVMKVLNGGQ